MVVSQQSYAVMTDKVKNNNPACLMVDAFSATVVVV